jgi:hypothetical protein
MGILGQHVTSGRAAQSLSCRSPDAWPRPPISCCVEHMTLPPLSVASVFPWRVLALVGVPSLAADTVDSAQADSPL